MRFHLRDSEKCIIFARFFGKELPSKQNRLQKYKELLTYAIFFAKDLLFWRFFSKKGCRMIKNYTIWRKKEH